jgi:large subunit ribosomal protein L13
MKTFSAKAEEVERRWYVIDAADQVLGKVAVAAANLLRGRTKPTFTPHADTGDFVIVVNAEKVKVTGKKELQKTYASHSGYVGNQKVQTVKEVRERHPEQLIHHAVKGMVPDGRLGRHLLTKLKVFKGPEHTHAAQQPAPYPVA